MLALALTLLLPATVQGEEEKGPSLTGFGLQASNGYVLSVLAGASPDGEEGWISLYLVRGKRMMVSYAAPATISPTTIDADLGKLGKISVIRVPTGRTRTVRWGCKPGGTKRVEAKRYEGTIEFHGEEGFAEVSATSAPVAYPVFCIRNTEDGGASGDKNLSGARLDVEKRRPGRYRLEFDAIQRRPGARTGVKVEVDEHRGEIAIQRSTWTWASAGALSYDRHLRTATVRPPAPFEGYGRFDRNDPGSQWSGNLTVDLPGRSDVPVIGPGFWASLERPRR